MAGQMKTIQTALDTLPAGTPDASALRGRVKLPPLPEGVTRRMLTRDVVVISLPSLVELVLTQLTSIADQIMVGQLPGEAGVAGLAAVGLAVQPKFLLMTALMALNVGTTALVARFRGQQNREKANQAFRMGLILSLLISLFFMGAGLLSSGAMVRFMSGTGAMTASTVALGTRYLDIQLYGFLPLCLTFTITAALRGIGESRLPLFYNTVANVVNIVLNWVMIYGRLGCPALGVEGAAWATVIGQLVAFGIALVIALDRRRYIHFDPSRGLRPDRGLLENLLTVGVPSMVEQLLLRIGIIIYSRSVAGLGDTDFATHQVCMSIQALSFLMGQAFANASTTLMGQSIGKGRYDMAALYVRQSRTLGILASLVLGALLILFNRDIISLYNGTPAVVDTGAQILILLAASQPFQADQFIASGALRGAGDTRFTAAAIAFTVLLVRNGLGQLTIHVLGWGLWGAWIALIADQLVRTVLVAARYAGGRWKVGAAKRFAKADAA